MDRRECLDRAYSRVFQLILLTGLRHPDPVIEVAILRDEVGGFRAPGAPAPRARRGSPSSVAQILAAARSGGVVSTCTLQPADRAVLAGLAGLPPAGVSGASLSDPSTLPR
jgi:hypothetical protein